MTSVISAFEAKENEDAQEGVGQWERTRCGVGVAERRMTEIGLESPGVNPKTDGTFMLTHLGANEAASDMIMMRRITATTEPMIIFFLRDFFW